MKKFSIIIVAALLFSCSTDDNNEDCNCQKETYDWVTTVITNQFGLPSLTSERVVISLEDVVCQEEQSGVPLPDGTAFNIICD